MSAERWERVRVETMGDVTVATFAYDSIFDDPSGEEYESDPVFAELTELCLAVGGGKLRLDFRNVARLGSSEFGMLIALRRRVTAAGAPSDAL